MARTNTTTQKATSGKVVADNFSNTQKKSAAKTQSTVIIACTLAHGLKFDDVPNGNGGTKTIVFPGVNDSLRGKRDGILLGKGNSVAFQIDKEDWENIKRMHGQEAVFTGVNGGLPCLMEMKSVQEFRDREDELKEASHGLNPIDPESVNVEEVKNEEG